jgi:hypothetical protein
VSVLSLLLSPCCSLILINEQIYGQLKQQIVASQMPDRQQHLAACLEKLMLVRLQARPQPASVFAMLCCQWHLLLWCWHLCLLSHDPG